MIFQDVVYQVLGDPFHMKTVAILLKHPEGISGRALSALLGTSTFKMGQVLEYLESQGILTHAVAGRSHLYRVNAGHILVSHLIKPVFAFQNGLLPHLGKEIADRLRPKPLSIILYGSMARGDAKPNSDLDLLFVYKDSQTPGPISENSLFMSYVTQRYGNPVTVSRSYVSDFKKRYIGRDEFVRNIVRDGKALAGLSPSELLSYGR